MPDLSRRHALTTTAAGAIAAALPAAAGASTGPPADPDIRTLVDCWFAHEHHLLSFSDDIPDGETWRHDRQTMIADELAATRATTLEGVRLKAEVYHASGCAGGAWERLSDSALFDLRRLLAGEV